MDQSDRNPSVNSIAENYSNSAFSTDTNSVEYWSINNCIWSPEYFERDFDMSQPPMRKKSSSRRSHEVQSSGVTSEDLPRETKNAQYKDVRYDSKLADSEAFMKPPNLGICDELRSNTPAKSNIPRFSDRIFEGILRNVEDKNETLILMTLTPPIVLSAEILAFGGPFSLQLLKQKVNSSAEMYSSYHPSSAARLCCRIQAICIHEGSTQLASPSP